MINWFGIVNFNGSDATFGIAFIAGVVSFLMPCVLPIVPGYISYLTGMQFTQAQTIRPRRSLLFYHSLLFVFGFLLVFMALGAASGGLGHYLAVWREWLQRIGGFFLIAVGLYLTDWMRWPALYKIRSLHNRARPSVRSLSPWHSVMTGFTFGFSWTPCIGPVLATILFLATFQGGSLHGSLLLLTFALGLGVPFVVTAVLLDRLLPWLRRFAQVTRVLQNVGAIIIIVLGLLLLTGGYGYLQSYLVRFTNPLL